MQFIINEEKFKSNYNINNGPPDHNQAKKIIILPYVTGYKTRYKEQIERFRPCIGEFCRLAYNKKISFEEIKLKDIDIFLQNIDVSSNNKVALKTLLKELFFDESENLYIFHPKLLNYIHMPDELYYKKLSKFLYDVLLNNKENVDIKNKLNECFECKSENIMELVILKNLPELEVGEFSMPIYKCICENVSRLFKEDLEFILDGPELITNEFEQLLKYYYFFYVSQLSIKLSKFFEGKKEETEKVYFTLSWEKASKSRISYNMGWKMLESHIKPLFSHVHTLEILNTNTNNIESYDYIDLNKIINNLSEVDRSISFENLESIKSIYINSVNYVQWENYTEQTQTYEDDNIKKSIYDLYKTIDYQFNNSGRYGKYKGYKDWFEEFCKSNFLRKAGSLGNMLNMTQEQLIFITKICIKNEPKIKLKDLFEEYHRRGIYFDRDSQEKIVELFEKLNIIEKKSDSGDAQYVRSIL